MDQPENTPRPENEVPPNVAASSSTGLDTKLGGLLCYVLGFVSGAVFLLIEKQNRDIRFHAYQSTLTFGAIFVLHLVASQVPVLGWLVSALLGPLSLILWILLMYKAFQGERFRLPLVGDWADEQAGAGA